jgi:exodeoxyribonuclease VII small subunit
MTEKKTLAQKMKALEQIVEKLNKDPEIEEAVKLYEEGVKTAASIREYLETAQTKIRVLTESGKK